MAAPARDYWAFLSYRHADNRELGRQWATWLHQRIETYEVPADLVGTTNARGDVVPERIFPVFRDEDELPADADLASPIYRALDASRCLVVLCSPRAAGSTYVADEITYYKRLGRADRVLATLLDGEPNVSWDEAKQAQGADPAAECFPAPLRHPVGEDGTLLTDEHAEPIAADLRLPDGSQGWTSPEAYRRALEDGGLSRAEVEALVPAYRERLERAVLKVIAGILGIPLGELTQRDKAYQLAREQRRARSFRRVAGAMALLALAAVVAGAVALHQRRIARENEAATVRALAGSDFIRGSTLLRDDRRVATGLAHLARAARRAAYRPARIRLWTLLQERAFWVPAENAASDIPPLPRDGGGESPPPGFETVSFEGAKVQPLIVVRSPDRSLVAVAVAGPPGEEKPRVRVFEAARGGAPRPRTGWIEPSYEGDQRIWTIRALTFSPDGRFLAVNAERWREPDSVEVFDLEAGRAVGKPLIASGEGSQFQYAAFRGVALVAGGVRGYDADWPLLVTASARGAAAVHVVVSEWNDLVPLAWAGHASPVVVATVDREREWLLSASDDGEVRVTRLDGGEAIGNVLQTAPAARALVRTGPRRLAARLADGSTAAWDLLERLDRSRARGRPDVPPSPRGFDLERGLEDASLEGPGGLRLVTRADGTVRTERDGARVGERRFPPDLRYVGIARHGFAVVTTDGRFVTEVWSPDLTRRLGPAIHEASLFRPREVPERMPAVDVDVAKGLVLTWSHYWDAPNLALYWRTVWDLETGVPLSDRAAFGDDGSDLAEKTAVDAARLAADGDAVLQLGGPAKQARAVRSRLELEPPAAARAWLPDLAEAIGGVTIDERGNAVPLPERAARLRSLLPERAAFERAP